MRETALQKEAKNRGSPKAIEVNEVNLLNCGLVGLCAVCNPSIAISFPLTSPFILFIFSAIDYLSYSHHFNRVNAFPGQMETQRSGY